MLVLMQASQLGPQQRTKRLTLEKPPRFLCRPLTVKLSGRAEAPDWSRGRILSSCARGDTIELHGPLQRLLERLCCRRTKLTPFLGTAVPRDCAQPRRQAKGS